MNLDSNRRDIEALCEEALAVDAYHVRERLKKLWPPRNPERVGGLLAELNRQLEKSVAVVEKRVAQAPKPTFPEGLPISERADEIIELIRENQVIVLAGETGSGKTTQIPKMCLAAGRGRRGLIGCTQPRRIAALSVGQRIAEELNTRYGDAVGSKIRFTEKTSEKTQIKLMTDGILLNELQNDPLLLAYDTLIIDEAHERSLNIDFILGALRTLINKRPDLKIIITSATIDTETFAKAFDGAPVIEVSGRTYPVEIRYRPLEEDADDDGEISFVSSAAKIAEEILFHQPMGDMLIFMPTEKDIRDTLKVLERRIPERRAHLLPLFGRMASGEQQAIFSASNRTKIIVATNIAETSITIPGIRYVIDSGLARVSRYSPHTATRRLPVEPISQSSAKQRAGRSGRVQNGVCVRLYDERDFESRPEFSTPEILRANLADVILRMTAFRLGSMDTFPFIEPPDARAIRGGYRVLEELGAIHRENAQKPWRLTDTGKKLARIPADPSVGRMILAAGEHNCVGEILVIAAALSIQDPRDMPADKRDAARQAQQEFLDKESDFLVYLNIWHALLGVNSERPSNRVLKQFCKKQFMSFQRMREWMDIHQQLSSIAQDFFGKKQKLTAKDDLLGDGIHQAILTGCIGNIAHKDEGNQYSATHGRKVALFPGSSLYDKKFATRERKGSNKQATQTTRHGATPEWIVCAEWMETSRLFARTSAKINPEWIGTIAPHLIKKTHSEPRYDKKSGRVVTREKHMLYGLTFDAKQVAFHPIDPDAATEIFIREGLLTGELPIHLKEVKKNLDTLEEAEEMLARQRQSASHQLEEALYNFYWKEMPRVSDVHSLRKWIRTQIEAGKKPLSISTDDLLRGDDVDANTEQFPKQVSFGNTTLDVNYAFKPGEDEDGATLTVGLDEFHKLNQGILDWVIPGYVEERIEHLVRGLPKDIRRQLFPIAENTRLIAQKVKPSPRPLIEILTQILWEDFKIRVGVSDWNLERVPDHLKPRIEVTDTKGKTAVASGRDWKTVQANYQKAVEQQTRSGKGVDKFKAWKAVADKWERPVSDKWPGVDLPPSIDVCQVGGVPVIAFPALVAEDNGVSVKLIKDAAEAARSNRQGMAKLVEQSISRDLGWLQKDLREIKKIGPALASIGSTEDIKKDAFTHLRNHLLVDLPLTEISEKHFNERAAYAAKEVKGIVYKFVDFLGPILELRHTIQTTKPHYKEFHQDMLRVVPKDFLRRTPFSRMQHLERYLKGFILRNNRARTSPPKDAEKWARVEPLHKDMVKWIQQAGKKPKIRKPIQELFWMLEEYRVSLFCQELGTDGKISEKRIREKLDEIAGLAQTI